jgi:DNA-binding NarL/FixJ family response regulator
MQKIKVFLADDHGIFREGVRLLLESQPDLEVVGEADDGREAIRLVWELSPDVALVDICMQGSGGLEAIREIRRLGSRTAVVALTVQEGDEQVVRVLEAGAAGYVPKRAAPGDLLMAIRAVYRDGAFLHPAAARTLLRNIAGRDANGRSVEGHDGLTEREMQVLRLLAAGEANRQVADQLGIAVGTVERHRANIMLKLGLHTRTDLIKYAIRRRLIAVEEV